MTKMINKKSLQLIYSFYLEKRVPLGTFSLQRNREIKKEKKILFFLILLGLSVCALKLYLFKCI